MIDLRLGDCLDVMRTLDANSIDAIVTDPPAGISFMGKAWDGDKGGRDKWITWMSEIAAECLRVLKPGGYALVWSLPRTSHWTGMAWENGGFEPRDRIAYCFGSGFPKSLDVSKAIDKAAGAEREVTGIRSTHLERPITTAWKKSLLPQNHSPFESNPDDGMTVELTAPATDSAREWSGWGTALKPAIEDWWVFRKPLSEGTVAANVLRWGTGALNVDAARVGEDKVRSNNDACRAMQQKLKDYGERGIPGEKAQSSEHIGRFPANLITDGSDEVRAMFPQTAGGGGVGKSKQRGCFSGGNGGMSGNFYNDTGGSASRFFAVCPLDEDDYPPLYYCAKASRGEREAGLDEMSKTGVTIRGVQTGQEFIAPDGTRHSRCVSTPSRNHHPTVKPLSLLRYLITLCTRPGATVLDPFIGSGSTGVAAVQLGRNFIGCDNETEYLEIAKRRIEWAQGQLSLQLPILLQDQVLA